MNETKPTDSADTPSKESEPSAPEQTSPVEAKGALNAAKEKARAAAEGVKDLKQKLAKHDIKAELREAFAETKKNPASLWKKPETLRPGKDLAVVGLAASVVLLLLLLVTSGSFFGFVCFVLGLGALLFSALGLKTEGRKLAIGGSIVGILVVLFALGQTFGSSDANETVAADASSGDYPVLVANKGKKTGDAMTIIKNAPQNASKLNSLNFFGFYTGMSVADFETLREHYGLNDQQLWFYDNVENGEVYRICFTTKALSKITNWPNNFGTVEINMLQYFKLLEWNNIKEIIQGEVDSIFQDEAQKLFFGDKANVPRQYRTADGVVAKLFPKGWDQSKYEVFDILDLQRQKPAAAIKRRFDQKNRMRKRLQELTAQGVKVKMLQLPSGYEWLLREFDDGIWISAFPMTRDEFTWLFYDTEYEKLSRKIDVIKAKNIENELRVGNLFADMFNALPAETKGSVVRFREPFPEEMKKAFANGIVDEKKYKEGYVTREVSITAFEDRAYPAVIVADEASSGQLERTAMFVVHGVASMKKAAWHRYEDERNNLIRSGKSGSELAALGYGKTFTEWKRDCEDQAVRDYVMKQGGVIDGGLQFLPTARGLETKLGESDEAKRMAGQNTEEPKREAEPMAPEISKLIASMIPIPPKWDYKMSRFEVTQAQWEAVMGTNPSEYKDAKCPVEAVSWDDCQVFLKKLNALPAVKDRGLVFRLPTAEEWGLACNAGAWGEGLFCKLTDGTIISEKTLGQVAWFKDNAGGKPHPVGEKKQNAFGLYDMYGNVSEWVADQGGGASKHYIMGSNYRCKATVRIAEVTDDRYLGVGLRLCSSVKAD